MQRKICVISPGTIASNPRVVKEAEALSEAGYKVHLIYTRHVDYLITADQEILDGHTEWTFNYLDWAGSSPLSYAVKIFSGVKRRVALFLLKRKLYSAKSAPYLLNRFYFWHLKKAVLFNADLYIAHYPDSIAIAAKAAIINNAVFAFDAEDYHRAEDIPREIAKAITMIEDDYLSSAAYISASSPLISKAYQKLYPGVKAVLLENMFQLKRQPAFIPLNDSLFKFFWFSQTIGPTRGLEEFISVLKLTGKKKLQLTLLGNCSNDYKSSLQKQWLKSGLNPLLLNFVNTLAEKDIFTLAAKHHFGLGLEIPSSVNRDICLTNKIYTYILSGNLLILSKTTAQRNFHESNPEVGICIELNEPKEAAIQIVKLMQDPDALNEKRRKNYELGKGSLNFDRQKEILLKKVSSIWE